MGEQEPQSASKIQKVPSTIGPALLQRSFPDLSTVVPALWAVDLIESSVFLQ
jgi:hypothetical protein